MFLPSSDGVHSFLKIVSLFSDVEDNTSWFVNDRRHLWLPIKASWGHGIQAFSGAVYFVYNLNVHFACSIPARAGHYRQRTDSHSALVTVFRPMHTQHLSWQIRDNSSRSVWTIDKWSAWHMIPAPVKKVLFCESWMPLKCMYLNSYSMKKIVRFFSSKNDGFELLL